MAAAPKNELKIFYSYSHKDQDYREQLESHLSNLKRLYNLQTWFDRQIQAGDNWESVLEEKLKTADLIFLLISPDFMRSDYCYNKEMTYALERHTKGEAKVIPILVRHVHWANAPFSHIQLLPVGARPVKSWSDPDEAFYQIIVEIEKVIQELLITRKTKKERLDSNHASSYYKKSNDFVDNRFDELTKHSDEPKVDFTLQVNTHQTDPENLNAKIVSKEEIKVKNHAYNILQNRESEIAKNQQAYIQAEEITVRFAIGKLNDYLQWFLMVLETLLAIRFLIKMFGADPTNVFDNFIFSLSNILLIPFTGIVPSISIHANQAFEFGTLIAILSYFLLFYAVKRFLRILISGPEDPLE